MIRTLESQPQATPKSPVNAGVPPLLVGDIARTASLFAATLALGLIAGFFYTYEVSVMRGFARLTDAEFVSAMQAVNATIRNWAFAPSFFGAALLLLVVLALHRHRLVSTKGVLIIMATLFYIGGALFLTLRINVPMNDWLAAQGPAALMVDPGAIRVQYEADWVFWNLVRTLNSGLAFLMVSAALWLDGKRE